MSGKLQLKETEDVQQLPLPVSRCLSKDQAAAYLGIGTTLLAELDIPCIRFGRRCVYDTVDLDRWLDEYKQRGRAGKEDLWPVKAEYTGEKVHLSGISMQCSRTAKDYAGVLGLKTVVKQKPC